MWKDEKFLKYVFTSISCKVTEEDSDRASYANVMSDVSKKDAYLFFILLTVSIFLKEYYKDLKNNRTRSLTETCNFNRKRYSIY